MKPYNIYLFTLAAAVAVTAVLAGCFNMKASEISTLKTGSPLKGVLPKTFAFKEFKDIRRVDPYQVWGGYKLDQPAASVVAMVIRKELERNGHRCVAYSAQANRDFIVEGSVSTYSVLTVGVKMTINPVSSEKGMFTKTYEGEVRGSYNGYTWNTKFNHALLAMVKEMSTDTDLIAFLEK